MLDETMLALDGVVQATIDLLESLHKKACEKPTMMPIPLMRHQYIADKLLQMYADDLGYTVEEVKATGQLSTRVYLYQCILLLKTRLRAQATATV